MDEFHGHLGCQATKFSERVFSILDQNQSGNLDLREFVTGVWNYCTYDSKLVSKVAIEASMWFHCSVWLYHCEGDKHRLDCLRPYLPCTKQ